MQKEIMPPSERKAMLFSEIRKYTSMGYKLTTQRTFFARLERAFSQKRRVGFWKKFKWVMFDIPEILKYSREKDIPESAVQINVDMRGNVEIAEV